MSWIFISFFIILFLFSKNLSKYILWLLILRPFITYFTGISFIQIERFKVSPGSIWAVFFILACFFFIINNSKIIKINHPIKKIVILFSFTFIPGIVLSEYHNVPYIIANYFKYLSWLLGTLVLFNIFRNFRYLIFFIKDMYYVLLINISLFVISIFLSKLGIISYENISAYYYKTTDTQYGYIGLFSSAHSAGIVIFLNYIFYKLKIKILDKNININKTRLIDIIVYIVLFLTFSRTIWLLMFIYLMITNSFNYKNFIRFILIVPLSFFILLSLNPNITEGFIYRTIGKGDKGNEVLLEQDYENIDLIGSGRFGIWKGVFYALQDFDAKDLFFGAGFGYDFVATGDYTSSKKAHNDFLTLILENGIINLILFIILLIYLIRLKGISGDIRLNYIGFYWGTFIYIFFQGLIGLPDFIYFISYYIIISIYFSRYSQQNILAQKEI